VNHPLWGRQIGPFSVFEYIGIGALLYAIFHVISKGEVPPILGTWQVRLVLILYLVALGSSLAGGRFPNPSLTIYTASMLLFPLAIMLVDTLERLRWAILSVVGGYAWASLYVIREWRRGSAQWSGYRPGFIVGDSNYFATAAIVAIILGFCLMQGKGPRWQRRYCLTCVLITVFGVMVCASRGGFLGLAVAFVFVIWRMEHRIRNFALLAVLILPLAFLLPTSPLQRLLHPNYAAEESEQYHQFAWTAGYHMIETHPLMGIGLGRFKPEMPDYLSVQLPEYTLAHNMFIEVAAELGLPALLCFIAIFSSTYFGLGRLRKSDAAPLIRDAASALQAGVAGLALAGCFVSAEYQKTTWTGLALAAALLVLAQKQQLAGSKEDLDQAAPFGGPVPAPRLGSNEGALAGKSVLLSAARTKTGLSRAYDDFR